MQRPESRTRHSECRRRRVDRAQRVGGKPLLRIGHRSVAILEGGILNWANERHPLTSVVARPVAMTYVPRTGADDFSITTGELAKSVQAGSTKVLDVRPPAAFRGEQSTETRPGHIPGAINRPLAADTLRTDAGQWLRPRAELEREYGELLTKDEHVTVSCRTGHSASHAYFVMRYLLGYRKVRWYNGSWTAWSARSELPAATGDN
jgi:thiosulfate/3-mercaptopyruvate sulfurtransferase